MKVQTKLTLLLSALTALVLAGSGIFSIISLDNYFRNRLTDELFSQANQSEFVVRTLAELDSAKYPHLQQYAKSADFRLTLIDSTGRVIFESNLPEEQLTSVENHSSRPEVRQAIHNWTGIDTRKSATLNMEMLYFAKKISKPFTKETGFGAASVIRVSVPLTYVHEIIDGIRSKIIIISFVVLIVVIFLSIVVSKRIASPIKVMSHTAKEIKSGNYEKRIGVRSNDELGELAISINGMVEKLNQDIIKLKKLEHVRSEFLANVSHELRTPIFAIQGMLETLLNGAIDDKQASKDFIERALSNTQRLNTLLGDLIEISRIESGEMKMSFRYFPLEEFIKTILNEMKPAADQRGVSLSLKPLERNVDVYGDRERLKQVMVNLIDNAMKYNSRGGSVIVSCRKDDSSVTISVSDTGLGIAVEHLPRIFERFYRVDKERSREAGGTGLGLAIVKHIIEAHGSKVEVRSEPGKGSAFSFMLKT